MTLANMNKNSDFLRSQYENKATTILVGGDLYVKYDVSIDQNIIDLFQSVDFSILNLEAPILIDNSGIYAKKKSGPSLSQKENAIHILNKLDVKYVGGANNHIMDYGFRGLKATKQILNENKIYYAGVGDTLREAQSPFFVSDISVICAGEDEFGATEGNYPGYYSLYSENILSQIVDLKSQNKFVIIFAHGGGEETPLPSRYILNRYKQFIDTGADLIIGHHPHVPRGYEEYNNKFIFYSLGNFIHDSFSKSLGVLLKIIIKNTTLQNFEIIPIIVQNHSIQLCNTHELNDYMSLCNKVLQDNLLLETIYQEQAHYMYESYYRSYFKDIFSLHKKIKNIIKCYLKRSQVSGELESEFLLLNLLRNKSHRNFIETALELDTKEIKDLRDEQSLKIFQELMSYINKFIAI